MRPTSFLDSCCYRRYYQQLKRGEIMIVFVCLLLSLSLPVNAMMRLAQHTGSKLPAATSIKRKNHTSKLSLMPCTPPGLSSQECLPFTTFEGIKQHLDSMHLEHAHRRKHIKKWSDTKLSAQLKWRKKIQACLKNHYENACRVHHDSDLPPFILHETKRLLKVAGINPQSVSILGNIPEQGPFAAASAPPIGIDDYDYFSTEGPAKIRFNTKKLVGREHEFLVFLIAREIGHLLNNHSYGIEENPFQYTNKSELEDLRKLNFDIDAAQNLEANVSLALIDKEVAHTIYRYLLKELSKPPSVDRVPTDQRTISPTEQSINEFYHWIKIIVDIHDTQS